MGAAPQQGGFNERSGPFLGTLHTGPDMSSGSNKYLPPLSPMQPNRPVFDSSIIRTPIDIYSQKLRDETRMSPISPVRPAGSYFSEKGTNGTNSDMVSSIAAAPVRASVSASTFATMATSTTRAMIHLSMVGSSASIGPLKERNRSIAEAMSVRQQYPVMKRLVQFMLNYRLRRVWRLRQARFAARAMAYRLSDDPMIRRFQFRALQTVQRFGRRVPDLASRKRKWWAHSMHARRRRVFLLRRQITFDTLVAPQLDEVKMFRLQSLSLGSRLAANIRSEKRAAMNREAVEGRLAFHREVSKKLPKDWIPITSASGKAIVAYINSRSGQRVVDHPNQAYAERAKRLAVEEIEEQLTSNIAAIQEESETSGVALRRGILSAMSQIYMLRRLQYFGNAPDDPFSSSQDGVVTFSPADFSSVPPSPEAGERPQQTAAMASNNAVAALRESMRQGMSRILARAIESVLS
jgi:hypothetical protein